MNCRVLCLMLAFTGVSAALGSSDFDDAKAAADLGEHAKAVRLYESAQQTQPELAKQIAPRLAREYLWADQAPKSLPLFREAVRIYPSDCELRIDYATALSWSNHLHESLSTYRDLESACPKYSGQVRLAEARVLRWMDKLSRSDELYAQLRQDPELRNSAEVGMVLNLQAEDRYRASLSQARQLLNQHTEDEALYVASAGNELRLGVADAAARDLEATPSRFASTPAISELRDFLMRRDNPVASTGSVSFHDRDGTSYISNATGFTISSPLSSFGVEQGISRLFGDTVTNAEGDVVGTWTAVNAEHRFNDLIAVSGRVAHSDFRNAGFSPTTGEFNAVFTPADRLRLDFSAAHLILFDNYQALAHHLAGNFVSVGADVPVGVDWTFTPSVDVTRWNEGNLRVRYRFRPAYRIQGRPRITLSVPLLYQTYDRSFSFNLFSPTRYMEVGPAINVFLRKSRHWELSAYGQVGGQHETASDWRVMGQIRAQAERDLWRHWATSLAVGWSNSNVASPTGFERFSLQCAVRYRFGDEHHRW